MALKKEQFLVGQPKRAKNAPKSKINSTKGTLTAGGRANAGPSALTPRRSTSKGVKTTKFDVYYRAPNPTATHY